MEEVLSSQLWQLTALAIDGCCQPIHIAKILNNLIGMMFLEDFFVTLPPNYHF
jgi:hypothetical protein